MLEGPIYERLRDPEYFARVVVDPIGGTVVWPNEADFAPEALHQMESEDNRPADSPSEIASV